ncbi:hypothetical protein A2642_01780 [Candidatus Nomurabacteria bacterium RIFCSPHIGHO2_01_FULL_39_10]|uniref:Uncharacterized protein n=1 Tax=Candidatus Nomurabacteria bacterium RIFCSPHIGHO2_01_FULL_39_10 TaxID=1801733 RepID=A0A1F6V478_9BACT|nr:MAG: hypothetical protein A2642_01780 [Candidatus Nomurabacteria bacterium RIFCSPHIGHO2_01_FULL_39_10]
MAIDEKVDHLAKLRELDRDYHVGDSLGPAIIHGWHYDRLTWQEKERYDAEKNRPEDYDWESSGQ